MTGGSDLRRRGAARRQLADAQGWSYADEHPELPGRWAEALGGDVQGAVARFLVSGVLDGHRVTVFDCVTGDPAARRGPAHGIRTVHLVELPRPLPLVAVGRHGLAVDTMVPLLKRLVAERPGRHLYEAGDPAYDATHVVETEDPEVAARLLTDDVREFADDRHWPEWRVDGDSLFYATSPGNEVTEGANGSVTAELRSLIGLVELMDPLLRGEAVDAVTDAVVADDGVVDDVADAVTVGAVGTEAVGASAMYRGGAAHTGVFAEGTAPPGFEAWSVRLGGAVHAEPAVCAGTLYVGCADGHCYALDAATGAARWRFSTGGALRRTPAVAHGTVYVVGDDGVLHALGADDGQERWHRRVGRSGHPVADGGLVYVVHHPANLLRDPSRLRALDAVTGEERWSHELSDGSASGPAVADGRVHVVGARGELSTFDAETGELLWEDGSDDTALSCCTPSVGDGVLYVGSGSGVILAFGARTGTPRWTRMGTGVIDSTPTVSGDRVYVADSHGGLYAVRAADGDLVWRLPGPYGATSLAVSGTSGWVVGAKAQRGLFRVGLSDGRIAWRYRLDGGGTAPVVAGGVVYVGTGNGTLLALDAATGRKPARKRRGLRV